MPFSMLGCILTRHHERLSYHEIKLYQNNTHGLIWQRKKKNFFLFIVSRNLPVAEEKDLIAFVELNTVLVVKRRNNDIVIIKSEE